METTAITLSLIWGPTLIHACTLLSVTQSPLYLASMVGHHINITCEIRVVGNTSQKVTSMLYLDGHDTEPHNQMKVGAENRTVTHHHQITQGPGVYYCRASCGGSSKDGEGSYIYVRDYFYVAPSSASDKLCSAMIALLILLLLLAASGTYLIVPYIRKRELQDVSPAQTRAQVSLGSEAPRSRPVVEDAGGSLYTSLEPRTEEVYDVLEDENKSKETGGPEKHQVEIHEVVSKSPVKRAKLQKKASSFQEKPPVKPKPKKNVSESNVYENLRR
ncbi:NFAT activation molecule 1 isoform 2-T2 [Anomaloglossus baeobatrachus]|uniref:NFAT activation molecule 1 isoform X2 n=1 Tax=Anomaloglossus baeobatrachus TaxID=238106 RepID=UPI003F50266F